MQIAFIDPGPVKSGWCVISTTPFAVVDAGHSYNDDVMFHDIDWPIIGVEMPCCYGSIMGEDLIGTCVMVGRVIEHFSNVHIPTRPMIAQHLAGRRSPSKSEVFACVVERLGKDSLGILAPRARGACNHARDALAGCIYLMDTIGENNEESKSR